jgi:hypothetical protein
MSGSGKAGGFEHWADVLYPASRFSTAGQSSLEFHLHWLEAQWPAGQCSSKHIPNNIGPNVTSEEVDWDVGDVHDHFSGAEETLAGHPGEGSVVVTTFGR